MHESYSSELSVERQGRGFRSQEARERMLCIVWNDFVTLNKSVCCINVNVGCCCITPQS